MRLWSLHPSILDRAALVAGWRKALLAHKVLAGGTRGYSRHPQLAHKLEHLRAKVLSRSSEWAPRLPDAGTVPPAHPLLRAFPGGIEAWEVLP